MLLLDDPLELEPMLPLPEEPLELGLLAASPLLLDPEVPAPVLPPVLLLPLPLTLGSLVLLLEPELELPLLP